MDLHCLPGCNINISGVVMNRHVAVLFARRDSIYKDIPFTDVFDEDRDALSFTGGFPVVAHPPCRGWGRLRAFSNHTEAELDLARFAVRQVRDNGGVLEHPYGSSLWTDQNLPAVGSRDQYGGYTLPVFQHWFGHRAQKATLLYIVGCEPKNIPAYPLNLETPSHVVARSSKGPGHRPEITKAEREATPKPFAIWLMVIAARAGQVFEQHNSAFQLSKAAQS